MTGVDARGEPAWDRPVFELTGGALCLDLVNTMADRPAGGTESLRSYGDLLAWAVQSGGIGAAEAGRLAAAAAGRPRQAAAGLARAIRVREALFRLFSALAAGRRPAPADLAALNGALGRALGRLAVAAVPEGGFAWRWAGSPGDLDRVLWGAIRSAADLLTGPDAAAVRECASDSCAWLFLDRSRNRSRRWCDMKACGNREKARRHYARRRTGEA